ncbi:putative duf21 and cbs domain protein [Phaeoacremonium minimum UCRPA7]|uniref:Putative duf21 and cbs domain protein n=1 Tax=Phaeoacremonium minimum (strain UCR-PA7) TaxID=1286976 RepID=R8BKJ2_PHAM7|nr:putative duf21 and cbs domain protein [Phaeoacremonium minimum UCRPA7]EON99840.1 putative duf21 and cbs domain protein [Phaeoacremonium minimum UCRPA7]
MGVAASAAPVSILDKLHDGDEAGGASLWVLYVASAVLVLLGGAFAGLTIALMGQDGIYLQVLAKDPSEPQQKNARRVYDLLKKGKHWVLVTLLLGNVIVNETLPVVLDRCLGGGVAAVIGSTVLIVIFGEVLPQSVCVRYGLPIGGYMSKPVLLLMYLMAPVAWPTAKLLDWVLGEDHGTVYKKSGLKTLVTLHRSLGEVSERLNQDEVTIIGAVLDLKGKPVRAVMTPMDDVFVMSEDTKLDEKTMDMILSAGYSRIPIHESGNPTNFIGMLLVKILITYDPEDGRLVKDFALATLPETRPETSCLDIINFFQEGKSHMVLVSEYPGEDHGAIGVVTLEDVIEELIGEEIIDESDVYIDVHKAIRRLTPAPKARDVIEEIPNDDGDETAGLLRPKPTGKDGIRALHQSYGAVSTGDIASKPAENGQTIRIEVDDADARALADQATQTSAHSSKADLVHLEPQTSNEDDIPSPSSDISPYGVRSYVRSGSITENVVESRGIRKVVLETTSSNESEEDVTLETRSHLSVPSALQASEEDEDEHDGNGEGASGATGSGQSQGGKKKKNRRKKRKGSKS